MPHSQEALARLIAREGLRDGRIVEAFRSIDRAGFVPGRARHRAYADRPVSIPHEQTTSQPSLIARMIDAAAPQPNDRVLEIGTGYGFQTALLSELAAEVVSIDRFPGLVADARRNLDEAGIENVELVVGEGWKGWPERAPYAAMIVGAAAEALPEDLAAQLDDGGRLVIPLKRRGSDEVILFVKEGDALVEKRLITPARFVPLVRAGNR